MSLPVPPVTALLLVIALVGLLAGCVAAVDARAAAREARWLAEHPPRGRLIGPAGRQIHVFEAGRPAGEAPDLVLIHGASGNLSDFTFDLVGRLAAEFRVIAVDRPGLGWSDTRDPADSDPQEQARILRAALAGLGLRRPVVVGHSYGAAVAMGWALEAPADTGALVLLAGATYPWPGGLGFWYRLNDGPFGAAGRQAVAALAPRPAIERVVTAIFAPDPVPAGYLDHFGAGLSMRRSVLAANTRQVNALHGYLTRMAPLYPTLRLPIELVHGSADTVVGLDIHSARLAHDVPGAHLTVLEGTGHMPHHAHPDTVVEAIRRAATRAGLR